MVCVPKGFNTKRLFNSLLLGIAGWVSLSLALFAALTNFGIDILWQFQLLYRQFQLLYMCIPLILFTLGIYRGVQELRKNKRQIDKLSSGLIVNIIGLALSLAVLFDPVEVFMFFVFSNR